MATGASRPFYNDGPYLQQQHLDAVSKWHFQSRLSVPQRSRSAAADTDLRLFQT